MKPVFELLSPEQISNVLDEAFQLMWSPGIKIQLPQARSLLTEAGAEVDEAGEIVRIPERLVYQSLESAPHEFDLYSRDGKPAVHYGGDEVHFDPGSSGVHVLDSETLEHRLARTADLVLLVQLAEMLDAYDAQSTAVVCCDVPKEIADVYRLYLVLLHSTKPIVTGAFSVETTPLMVDMLALFAGSGEALRRKPLAVFDVCPTPPLTWGEFGAQNLIDLAQTGVPAEIVSMPLAGATAPVTLLGSVVQHAAETLSGITIHQLAQPGAPVVWGGAPAIFDMRHGTTPMGAIETAMIDVSYAQVGKALGLPTHTYMGASDAKLVDAQAGLESGVTAVIGALAGINMISGAGMLDFLACQCPEKLVIDAEAIAMARRLLEGVTQRTESLATEMFAGLNFEASFLKQKVTRRLFREEQLLPSTVIDRGSLRTWRQEGGLDAFGRARQRVEQLQAAYERSTMSPEQERDLRNMMSGIARAAGLDELPALA